MTVDPLVRLGANVKARRKALKLTQEAAAGRACMDMSYWGRIERARNALRVLLRDAGYDVIAAETGEEALDRIAVRQPEAAIVDLMLPGIDGVEVCRRLREWSQIPVIVLSAVHEDAEKVRALRTGADDYVTKPFSPEELLARLEAAAPGDARRPRAAPDADRVLAPAVVDAQPRR